ncbi:MAG: hypothetical protein ABIP51_19390 [Bacteroidia bacterium]
MNLSNITAHVFRACLIFFCVTVNFNLNAQQDTLFKKNGEKIACKILEVGTQAISFKKADNIDGPTFVENKVDLLYAKFKNGQKEEFKNTATATEMNTSTVTAVTQPNKNGIISEDYKIIHDGKNFFVNGSRVRPKSVDRLLSRSNNPAVLIPYKTAKLTKTIQKVVKFTSIGTSVGGGIACVSTFYTLAYQSIHDGVTPDSWINAGLSVLGTITLPITSSILKKRTSKLYDKTIDIYNVGKK